MSPTEMAAYGWLIDQAGYAEKDIAYQPTQNPDFVTVDGRGWEIKRLTGRVASFTLRQIADLRQQERQTTVLFWQAGGQDPVAHAAFSELPMPGWWNNIKTYVVWQPRRGPAQGINSSAEVDALVDVCRVEGRGTFSPRTGGTAEVAARLNVCLSTVRRWIKAGDLPAIKTVDGQYSIDTRILDEWMAGLDRQKPTAEVA